MIDIVSNSLYITKNLKILVSDSESLMLYDSNDKKKLLAPKPYYNPIYSVCQAENIDFNKYLLSDKFELMSYYENIVRQSVKNTIALRLYKNNDFKQYCFYQINRYLYPILATSDNKLIHKFTKLKDALCR